MSNFGVMNEDLPTRMPSNGQETSPDVTLASPALLPTTDWCTTTALGSDHLPIIITLASSTELQWSENKTYVNFKKARWEDFKAETEEAFASLEDPADVYTAEKNFRLIVNKASKYSIPHGRIPKAMPEFPTAAAEKAKEWDEIRKNDPQSPRISELNQQIQREVTQHRTNKWRELLSKMDRRTNVSKLRSIIKKLSGKVTPSSVNQAIHFDGKPTTSSTSIAEKFNKQYSSVVPHTSSKESRKITRLILKKSLEDAPVFTHAQTAAAIKRCKSSKAMGPDEISNLHLKHLGPRGIDYLTKICNLSVSTCKIPSIWKSSKIIPLLKPGKDANESKSYRPISLLCPGVKILEPLILPILNEHLVDPDHQHGFRMNHSTVTALHDFNVDVANGFNQKKPPGRTVLLQIDMSKAFDRVSHDKLLQDLDDSNLPSSIKRWFQCYLHGRQSKVIFRGKASKMRNVRTGVPQGAVTSPKLFTFYMSNMPVPDEGVKIIQYADDISIYSTCAQVQDACDAINEYVPSLLEYLKERQLEVSPEKFTVTLFTPDTHQAKLRPNVAMDGVDVPLEQKPRLLGVHFDTMYTFAHHVKISVSRGKQRVNVLKSLAGTSWGQSKEVLIETFKYTGRTAMEYAGPIWQPVISATNWKKLQTVQNEALRVSTGCLRMSHEDYLHKETHVLPIKQHCQLLADQFLMQCHQFDHPGRKHLDQPPPPRKMKRTIMQRLEDDEVRHVAPQPDAQFGKAECKATIKTLHTEVTTCVLQARQPNRVLDDRAPDVSKEEVNLPRVTRTTLAQLRSGFSRMLNSYQHRIDEAVADKCPLCERTPHDTAHLFDCPRTPTDLMPIDLWKKPKEVAAFLGLPAVQDA